MIDATKDNARSAQNSNNNSMHQLSNDRVYPCPYTFLFVIVLPFNIKPSKSIIIIFIPPTSHLRHLNLSSISLRPESPLNERRISDILKFGWVLYNSLFPPFILRSFTNQHKSVSVKQLAISAFPPQTSISPPPQTSPPPAHSLTSAWGEGDTISSIFPSPLYFLLTLIFQTDGRPLRNCSTQPKSRPVDRPG